MMRIIARSINYLPINSDCNDFLPLLGDTAVAGEFYD